MELTVQIPDELASRMSASGADLSRRALEALALEEFKGGRITKPELRRLLGFGTRYQLDGFLKPMKCTKTTRCKTWSKNSKA